MALPAGMETLKLLSSPNNTSESSSRPPFLSLIILVQPPPLPALMIGEKFWSLRMMALRSPCSETKALSVQQLHLRVDGLKLNIRLCLSPNRKSEKQDLALLSPSVNSEP